MKNTSVGRTWENGPVEIHSFGGILLIFFFHFLLFPARSNPVLEEEESKILRESRFSSQGTGECGRDPGEDLLRMSRARAEPTHKEASTGSVSGLLRSPPQMLRQNCGLPLIRSPDLKSGLWNAAIQ